MAKLETLELRFAEAIHMQSCFVCSLPAGGSTGWITVVDTRTRHTPFAHPRCWTLVLRYAQAFLDTQIAERGKK